MPNNTETLTIFKSSSELTAMRDAFVNRLGQLYTLIETGTSGLTFCQQFSEFSQLSLADEDYLRKAKALQKADAVFTQMIIKHQKQKDIALEKLELAKVKTDGYTFTEVRCLHNPIPIPEEHHYMIINNFMRIFQGDWSIFAEVLEPFFAGARTSKIRNCVNYMVTFFAIRHMPALLSLMTDVARNVPAFFCNSAFSFFVKVVESFLQSLVVLRREPQALVLRHLSTIETTVIKRVGLKWYESAYKIIKVGGFCCLAAGSVYILGVCEPKILGFSIAPISYIKKPILEYAYKMILAEMNKPLAIKAQQANTEPDPSSSTALANEIQNVYDTNQERYDGQQAAITVKSLSDAVWESLWYKYTQS